MPTLHILGVIQIDPTNPVHVDELCPGCWLPAVWRIEFATLTDHGVTLVPLIWTGCVDCPAPGRLEGTLIR